MAKPMTCFLVTSTQGSSIEQKIIDDSKFTVGRSIEATLAFPDPNISRLHLEVKIKNDVVTIEDKGSANGTFIGDTQISPNFPVEINVGDVIRFGKSEISMQVQVFEKTFPKDAAKNSALNKDGSKMVVQLIEAAHADAARIVQHAQDSVQQVAQVAQAKAEKVLADAEAQKRVLVDKGQADADQLVAEGRQKVARILKTAEVENEEAKKAFEREMAEEKERRMAKLNAEAAKEIESTLEAARKTLHDNKTKADEMIRSAEAKCDQIVLTAESKALQITGAAQAHVDAAVNKHLEEARQKTEKEREEFLRQARFKADQDVAKKLRDMQFGWEKEKNEKVRLFEDDFGSRTRSLESDLQTRKMMFEKEEGDRKATLARYNLEISETSKIVDALKNERMTIEPKVIEARAELEARSKEADAQKRIYNELLTNSRSEDDRLRRMREELFTLDTQINSRRTEFEKMKDLEKEHLKAIEELDRKKHFAKGDFDEMVVKLGQLQDEFQKKSLENETTLKFDKERMQKEKESIAFAIQLENEKLKRDLEGEVQKIRREHERVNVEFSSLKDAHFKTQSELTEAETLLKAVQPQYIAMKEELTQFQAKKESLEKAIKTNQDSFENAMKAFQEHEAEAAKVRLDSDNRLKLAREDYEKASDQLKALRNDIGVAKDLNEKLTTEFKKLTQDRDSVKIDIDRLTSRKAEFESEFKNYTQKNTDLKNTVSNLEYQLQEKTTVLADVDKEYQKQMALFKNKLDEEQRRMQKENANLADEMKLAEVNRISKIKEDMLVELSSRKEQIIKQAHRDIEMELTKHIESGTVRSVSEQMERVLRASFEGSTASIMTASNAESSNPSSLLAKKRRERFVMAAMGVLIGLAVMPVYNVIEGQVNASSYKAAVDEKIKKERDEYDSRRFRPPQDDDLRSSYTESVIYTKGFVAKYSDDGYQKRLNNAVIDYFLDKWRVEEEVSIRATAVVYSLINALEEKRRNIHPDFVKENVDKMHELEKETNKRLEEILGSKVRLEAYKKFEKKFFENDSSRIPAAVEDKEERSGKSDKADKSKANESSEVNSEDGPPESIEISE